MNVAPLDVHTRNRPKSTDVQEQKKARKQGAGESEIDMGVAGDIPLHPKIEKPPGP